MSTKAGNGQQPITVEMLRGAEATDPQIAIKIGDEFGVLFDTLYVISQAHWQPIIVLPLTAAHSEDPKLSLYSRTGG